MKKLLILAVAALLILPATAMAGITAFMDMDEMSDNELAETTGQTGITLNATLAVTGGYIAWGDDDGCAGTTANAAWLTLNNLTASGIVLDGTLIDVCNDGTNDWLTIQVPAMTINAGVGQIQVGNAQAAGSSMGELAIVGLQVSGMTLQVTGH